MVFDRGGREKEKRRYTVKEYVAAVGLKRKKIYVVRRGRADDEKERYISQK